MSLPGLSIRRPVMGWMLTAAILIFGALSLRWIGISQYPDIDNPFVTISVGYCGTAPELIEIDITEILESALLNVEGVTNMS